MVAMGIKTTVVILHRPSRRDWKTSSRVRIGFRLPCHSKAFQKSGTAVEEGVSVSSWCSGPLIQNWG